MGHSSERCEVPASPPWTHPASGKTLPKYFISLPSVHSFYKNWPDILLYIPSTVQGALGLKRWKYSVFLLWNSSWRREMRQEETEREWVLSSSELHYNLCTIKKEQGAVTEVTCLPGLIRRMSFTVPQFPHLQNRDNNRTFLKGLERGINGYMIHVRCSEHCLVYRTHYRNVCCHYHHFQLRQGVVWGLWLSGEKRSQLFKRVCRLLAKPSSS